MKLVLKLSKSAPQISQKALSQHLFLTRLVLEQSQNPTETRLGEASRQLSKTIQNHKSIFTSTELSHLSEPVGSWSPALKYQSESRWESLGILLFALKIFKSVPPYDTKFPREEMYKSTAIIPAFEHTITAFLEYFETGEGSKHDHVVDDEELRVAVNTAEAWFWRARAQVILDLKTSIGNDRNKRDELPIGLKQVMKNIEEAIRFGTQRALADKLVETAIKNDFGVFGQTAYSELGDHEIRDLNRIAESRLATLGWLMGTHEWEYDPGELKFINPMGSLWSPE